MRYLQDAHYANRAGGKIDVFLSEMSAAISAKREREEHTQHGKAGGLGDVFDAEVDGIGRGCLEGRRRIDEEGIERHRGGGGLSSAGGYLKTDIDRGEGHRRAGPAGPDVVDVVVLDEVGIAGRQRRRASEVLERGGAEGAGVERRRRANDLPFRLERQAAGLEGGGIEGESEAFARRGSEALHERVTGRIGAGERSAGVAGRIAGHVEEVGDVRGAESVDVVAVLGNRRDGDRGQLHGGSAGLRSDEQSEQAEPQRAATEQTHDALPNPQGTNGYGEST